MKHESLRPALRLPTALVVALALSACAPVGPDYVRPAVEAAPAYKEIDGWKIARPGDHLARGKWWEAFGDAQLNALVEQVEVSNQNVLAAEAQFRQASAVFEASRAAYFPKVTGSAGVTRSQSSDGGTTNANANGTNGTSGARDITTSRSISLGLSWEADVWGRLRRSAESGVASAQASAADLASARLSAQAQLVQSYFQMRQVDAQQVLYTNTLEAYRKSLEVTQNRYKAGVAARADVVQAQTQLQGAQVSAIDLGIQRAQLEHAIALLVGKPASAFAIAPAPLSAIAPPLPPLGLPSDLLERRPDIAAAERRVAAANAQIGVAEAAWYPSLTLSAQGGYSASDIAKWLTAPSRFWSIGPQLAATLFDGGARQAQGSQARASYDASVATYRQTVLSAFQQVEDSVASLRILEQEAVAQDEALRLARQALALTMNQYKAGVVSYINVVAAQQTALSNERAAVGVQANRLVASAQLVKALGGGWSVEGAGK